MFFLHHEDVDIYLQIQFLGNSIGKRSVAANVVLDKTH